MPRALPSLLLCLLPLSSFGAPLVEILVPGFKVEELPVQLSNVNNLRFSPEGTLTTLGYDGRIHLLTDADNDMSMGEIDNVVRKSKRSGAMICTIEFGRGPDPKRQNFLFELANRTGGSRGYVDVNTLKAANR